MRNWQTSNKYLLPERALNLANFIMLDRKKILELDFLPKKMKVKNYFTKTHTPEGNTIQEIMS
jgi:hypothetical protein